MILLTGAAGFIGFHTAQALLARGESVVGIDNLNDYYDPLLKKERLARLMKHDGFRFTYGDIADAEILQETLENNPAIDRIVHLAAQAGVRYSLKNPYAYANSNLTGQVAMLEAARHCRHLKHFVYASSSSVYGANTKQPFAVEDPVDLPVSLYAATKRAGELLTQSYSHLYGFPATGLRFFTVYGPWGRPDMAYFTFTRDIIEGRPLTVFNHGRMKRDFTWIDDIVHGILGALDHPPAPRGPYCYGDAPHRILNLGNNRPENLVDFIAMIEECVGRKAEKIMAPLAPGDVEETWADIGPAQKLFGYSPQTPLATGIPRFVQWYADFYGMPAVA